MKLLVNYLRLRKSLSVKNDIEVKKMCTLRRQPVPELSATMSKFLLAVKPLLNETEFEETQKTAKDFMRQGGVGEKLQRLLVERSKATDNWVII